MGMLTKRQREARDRGLLYDPRFEHDACGVGFVADVSGRQSHATLRKGIESVCNVTHRGAVSADAKTGDGAGVMTQIPRAFFRREIARLGKRLDVEDLAVGMIFLPGHDEAARDKSIALIDEVNKAHGFKHLGWRRVPVDKSALGEMAAETEPDIRQVMLGRADAGDDDDFGRRLYLARKEIETRAAESGLDALYIPSFSHKTLVYKGLLVAPQLSHYYRDLEDPDFETAITLFHQRYSTNTFPNWFLAQPFRYSAHNGEINTLWGNYNWMRAREPELESGVWGDRIGKLLPVIDASGSDSSQLDNVAELYAQSGRDILHTMMMLVPEAWENMPHMKQRWRDFYQYHASLQEPWDGPAALAFTDGDIAGASLDRNGLRPARYKYTDDGIVVMGSEVGILNLDDARVIEKGRLGPGQMIAVDTKNRRFISNDEIKNDITSRESYGKLARRMVNLGAIPEASPNGGAPGELDLFQRQRTFGYTLEDLSFVIKAMVLESKDPVFSMGDDTALSVLATMPRLVYSFFKQRFAQVTNPPIDPLREELVMALDTYLGARHSVLEPGLREHGHLIHLDSPILFNEELEAIRNRTEAAFKSVTLDAVFAASRGPGGLEEAIDALCEDASAAIDDGASIVVISDRKVDEKHAPIPMLLAVGSLHQHLIRQGKRMRASLVAESAEPREVHHFACLLGYGASAINPYLGLETLSELIVEGDMSDMSLDEAKGSYRKALNTGILKIMSKMGISTVTSYHGAQIFEAIGLSEELIEKCFTGTTSWIGGLTLNDLGEDVIAKHERSFEPTKFHKLDDVGYYRFRRDGERHTNSPQMVRALHAAVKSNSYEDYKVFSDLVQDREPMEIRDLLKFKPQNPPVPLDEVEPAEEIMKRFNGAAMSLGALSPEAHVTLATALNMIGGKSDTGEGGDEPARYWPTESGPSPHSRIKQIASGRFGVTVEYLASGDEIEIKMAQGSKPGEGGQLPGHKVMEHIARLRHSKPGTPLISPPPHHDIYSIEDLAQLIYDLKMVNPRARVTVKLVSEAGVGTIAAGVAKGYADNILISGDSGGTGASPLSSIKNAGSSWELGLAETQQVLVLNDLRGRVLLRTDGGLKTGRDLVVAAILGAEEYNFGTAALIAIGCKMARQCHLNTCPVGVATQKEELRQKFFGTPEMAVTYFNHVAMETREVLASIGVRSLDEIIGRTELLEPIESDNPRIQQLNLERVLADPDPSGTKPRKRMQPRNDRPNHDPIDDKLVEALADAIDGGEPLTLDFPVGNEDRTVGARVSGAIATKHRTSTLERHVGELRFKGSAGQSFGAFCSGGLRLVLEGEANDYVGKGMAGGEIVIKPPANARFTPHKNIIIGNTVLYGATGGRLFAAGRAGERFAVRNSGATAVIEGAGDHCCEYMTAGLVVVLGETGRNFGAGMSEGVAYVLDEDEQFPTRYNPEMITLERVRRVEDAEFLRSLIEEHYEATGSQKANEILGEWEQYRRSFWKVVPRTAHDNNRAAAAPSADVSKTPVGAR